MLKGVTIKEAEQTEFVDYYVTAQGTAEEVEDITYDTNSVATGDNTTGMWIAGIVVVVSVILIIILYKTKKPR